mgnify:CR=1 FL=1
MRELAQRLLEQKRVLQKSQTQLGVACTCLLNEWEPLSTHLRHGTSQLDNNKIENAIRPTALGKKNGLFFGHPDAGKRSAVLYSPTR